MSDQPTTPPPLPPTDPQRNVGSGQPMPKRSGLPQWVKIVGMIFIAILGLAGLALAAVFAICSGVKL